MRETEGGVCAPRGFRAGGVRCGIKESSKKRDLALICSERPCAAAALFTTNQVKAASVLVTREHLAGGTCRAVIANSGNAHACTGEGGSAAARRMAVLAADLLGIEAGEVAVASTGVIGVPLPIGAIEAGMTALGASLRADGEGHEAALEAIMTTDIRKKDGALEADIGGRAVRLGGMVKGSGMIHPNMATMLGFITTDAAIRQDLLDRALRRAVGRSFNRVTVDGDTSTNDMILILANGAAGNIPIEAEGDAWELFAAALEKLCVRLARAMARDGEGASRLITVTVTGAEDEDSAAILARSVAGSSLVKAACFGADANWGRVLCALGYSGVPFDPSGTDVRFESRAGAVQVCRQGGAVPFSEEEARRVLSEEEIDIRVELRPAGKDSPGPGSAAAWGCDLSYEYVKINGDYRT
jgi:glutamate N-acetyltransferase/amino-acid N-acetyltransferase